jgi:hypothetical protein
MSVKGGLRHRVCPDCGDMHDKYNWPDNHRLPHEELCAPMLISDNQPPVQSMLDGKIYDSKAALRATYRPSGNREGKYYTEVGNDSSVLNPKAYKKPKPDRMKIKAAVHGAFSKAGFGA